MESRQEASASRPEERVWPRFCRCLVTRAGVERKVTFATGSRSRAAKPTTLTRAPSPFEAAPFDYVHVDLRYLAKLEGRGEVVFVAIEIPAFECQTVGLHNCVDPVGTILVGRFVCCSLKRAHVTTPLRSFD